MIAAAAFYACGSASTEEAAETEVTADEVVAEEVEVEAYGEEISTEGAVEASELIAMLDGQDSVQVKVKGTINEVCQKKGCWMNVAMGEEEEMLVRFKDYGFFVPMDADGRTVTMEGWAKVEEQSVEWLRHQAEDAGASEEEIAMITEPEVSVSFMASGVVIE
ncbi:DUF4920 domain-containing protein [Cryomorphaceae bacterium]|nr:DUF4920 domain-containing protein [Cryomorphaceae bacterium]